MSLSSLPIEVIEFIFHFLDFNTKLTLTNVSRKCQNILKNGHLWKSDIVTDETINNIIENEEWSVDNLSFVLNLQINGENIKFCETCYQEDAMGAHSKRASFIEMNYDDNKHLVEEAEANDGYMTSLPSWWELRLRSICNQACRMCIPQTSSKIS